MKTTFLALSALAALTCTPAHAADPKPSEHDLPNGKFSVLPVGQPPAGWKPAYPNAGGVIFNDGKETFLRLSSAQPANAGVSQELAVPPKAVSVNVYGRMRGKPQNLKTEKNAAVEVALRYKDAKGANISAAVVASGNSPYWHTFRRTFTLPPGCVKIEVLARSLFAVGNFDFAEVRADFK